MRKVIVVGGGIAGILAALEARRRGAAVTLIEQAASLGGVLGSIAGPAGASFDFGTHILSTTGDAELDAFLFQDFDEREWNVFEIVRAGTWFGGRMSRESPFIDARALPPEVFRLGLVELLETRPFDAAGCRSLGDLLRQHFGATFAERIQAPIVAKQFGCGLDDLHPRDPFVLKRLIVASPETSRELKRSPFFDGKVAFATFHEGTSPRRNLYPKAGGIGRGMELLEKRLRDGGVEILTKTSVTRVTGERAVETVTLSSGATLPCDRLVWTVPPFLLLRAASIELPAPPPKIRSVGLYHFVFDRPFAESNQYVTCYDEHMVTFRVTLYPHLRSLDAPGAPWNLTVEVLGDESVDFASLAPRVEAELHEMGILATGTKRLHLEVARVASGFPAFTHSFVAALDAQTSALETRFANALLLGRARCPPFFMTDVLIDTWQRVRG